MKANKALGQNFLIDKNIIRKIVDSSMIEGINEIIEVGPGRGALTKEIVKKKDINLTAIEIDEELYDILIEEIRDENFNAISANVLDIDLNDINKGKKYSLVANLPYYISSKIIFKFLEDEKCESMTIMLQKELVDRIMSKNKSKEYGRLTVAIQSFFTPKRVVNVPPTCFKPRPKVESAVVQLLKNETNSIERDEITLYLEFIKQCFNQKRKTLRNNLKGFYDMELIEKSLSSMYPDDWDFIRSEYITISEFKKLFKMFKVKLQENSAKQK